MALSLADPTGSDPILAAVNWFEATFLGPVATTVSVLAVAVIGLMMLNGRISAQRAITVIIGCFIVAGAHSIATGIRGFAESGAGAERKVASAPVVPAAPSAADVPRPPQPHQADPFAGASVPTQR